MSRYTRKYIAKLSTTLLVRNLRGCVWKFKRLL